MTAPEVKSRKECLRESWIVPTLDEVCAIKRSAAWNTFPDDKKEMYDAVEEGWRRLKARGENKKREAKVVVIPRVSLHGAFEQAR